MFYFGSKYRRNCERVSDLWWDVYGCGEISATKASSYCESKGSIYELIVDDVRNPGRVDRRVSSLS